MKLSQYLLFLLALACISLSTWLLYKRVTSYRSVAQHEYSIDRISDIKNFVPVAVIGSGPAGLSAALYTARMNLYTIVFSGSMPGGQLMGTTQVENWPAAGTMLGPEIMKKLEKHVQSFGVQLVPESIERVDFNSWPYTIWTDEGKEIKALSVIIATGAKPKKLNIPGESEFWGKGVTTCAVCDAPFYKGRNVAVVGGGDSAAEQAMELAAVAKSVTMLVRGSVLRASAIMQDRLKGYPNITTRYNTQVKKVLGKDHVTGIELADGSTLPIDGFFLAIGHEPNTQMFKSFITCDEAGYIQLKSPTQETSKPGIFAAGDVADHRYRQAGVASGDGIKAALDGVEFLRNLGFNETVAKRLESRYFDVEKGKPSVAIQEIGSSKQIDDLMKNEKRALVLDFYAPYCPSCMQMLPVVESVAAKVQDTFKFVKIDTGKSDELAKRFDVPMIPTLLVIKGGKLFSRSTEIMNKPQLMQFIHKSINAH